MQQVFISYSRKDIAFVRKLAGDLEKAGYDVWWDVSDLRGGDDWLRVIPTAIDSSHFSCVTHGAIMGGCTSAFSIPWISMSRMWCSV